MDICKFLEKGKATGSLKSFTPSGNLPIIVFGLRTNQRGEELWECKSWDNITDFKDDITSYMRTFPYICELVQKFDEKWKMVSRYSEGYGGDVTYETERNKFNIFATLLNLGFSEDVVIKIRNNKVIHKLLDPKNLLQAKFQEFSPEQQLAQIKEVTGHRP